MPVDFCIVQVSERLQVWLLVLVTTLTIHLVVTALRLTRVCSTHLVKPILSGFYFYTAS